MGGGWGAEQREDLEVGGCSLKWRLKCLMGLTKAELLLYVSVVCVCVRVCLFKLLGSAGCASTVRASSSLCFHNAPPLTLWPLGSRSSLS